MLRLISKGISEAVVIAFTETWLDTTVPDNRVTPPGLTIHCLDGTTDSDKPSGSMVCVLVSSCWRMAVSVVATHSSHDDELAACKV